MGRGAPLDNAVIEPQQEEHSSMMFINQLTIINHGNTFSKGNGNKQKLHVICIPVGSCLEPTS